MRFSGEQVMEAPLPTVWSTLLDHEVLRAVIPGCERLVPIGPGRYAATLAVRCGPIADSYRGHFAVQPLRPERDLRVVVDGRGRFGRLELDLDVALDAVGPHTRLGYDAQARVGGLVSRVGDSAMSVVGGFLTGCFFRDLERTLARRPVAVAG